MAISTVLRPNLQLVPLEREGLNKICRTSSFETEMENLQSDSKKYIVMVTFSAKTELHRNYRRDMEKSFKNSKKMWRTVIEDFILQDKASTRVP